MESEGAGICEFQQKPSGQRSRDFFVFRLKNRIVSYFLSGYSSYSGSVFIPWGRFPVSSVQLMQAVKFAHGSLRAKSLVLE